MRAVVVSSRLTDRRRAALGDLLGEPAGSGEGAVFVEPGELGRVGERPPPGAVVLDGPLDGPSPLVVARLRDWVQGGTAVLALGPQEGSDASGWAPVLGAGAGPRLPTGEIFVRVVDGDDPLVARVDAEFALVDAFQALHPQGDAARPLLGVTYHFVDRPALVVTERGRGRIVVSGLGNTDEALASPALATVLRRALRQAHPDGRRVLGVGVVGYGPYGGMGLVHGTAASATPGLEMVAACDRDPARRKAAEHDFPDIRVHEGLDDLAADDGVDVAVVATPPSGHVAAVSALLQAGKHVVCEKPLCFTVADADRLFALAADRQRVLTVNQSRRWDRDFLAVRAAVEDGELGHVFNVETFVGGFAHPCRAWHSEAAVSGGTAYDWGAHHVDWILQLLGSAPARVAATGHKRVWHDITNLDQLRVHMTWDDGREAEFVVSDVAALRRPKFYVQGTAGTLAGTYQELAFERLDPVRGYVRATAHHAERPAALTLARYCSGSGVAEAALALPPDRPFAFHRNLADHLLAGDALAVTPHSARQVVSVLEAATHSAAAGGRAVTIG